MKKVIAMVIAMVLMVSIGACAYAETETESTAFDKVVEALDKDATNVYTFTCLYPDGDMEIETIGREIGDHVAAYKFAVSYEGHHANFTVNIYEDTQYEEINFVLFVEELEDGSDELTGLTAVCMTRFDYDEIDEMEF